MSPNEFFGWPLTPGANGRGPLIPGANGRGPLPPPSNLPISLLSWSYKGICKNYAKLCESMRILYNFMVAAE